MFCVVWVEWIQCSVADFIKAIIFFTIRNYFSYLSIKFHIYLVFKFIGIVLCIFKISLYLVTDNITFDKMIFVFTAMCSINRICIKMIQSRQRLSLVTPSSNNKLQLLLSLKLMLPLLLVSYPYKGLCPCG